MTRVESNELMDSVPSITQHNWQAFCTWINHRICGKILLAVKFTVTDAEPWRWLIVFDSRSQKAAGLKARQRLLGKHSAGWPNIVCLVCLERHPTETFHLSVCFWYGRVYKNLSCRRFGSRLRGLMLFAPFFFFSFCFSCVTENQPVRSPHAVRGHGERKLSQKWNWTALNLTKYVSFLMSTRRWP